MTLKQIGLFVWYLFRPNSTEKAREAEIDAVGGGMKGPKK